MQQLPLPVRRLWQLSGAVTGLILGGLLAGGIGAATYASGFGLPGYLIAGLVLLGMVVLSVWWAGVRFRNWRWQITPEWVEARYGVLGRHRVIIPRNRVQTVTTNSGPIDRMLDLETITVHTAGVGAPNLTIPHLTTATVAQIRQDLGRGVDD